MGRLRGQGEFNSPSHKYNFQSSLIVLALKTSGPCSWFKGWLPPERGTLPNQRFDAKLNALKSSKTLAQWARMWGGTCWGVCGSGYQSAGHTVCWRRAGRLTGRWCGLLPTLPWYIRNNFSSRTWHRHIPTGFGNCSSITSYSYLPNGLNRFKNVSVPITKSKVLGPIPIHPLTPYPYPLVLRVRETLLETKGYANTARPATMAARLSRESDKWYICGLINW